MSQIESTYKARDVEETIDIYFYRPLGYLIARLCRAIGITPNAVTVFSVLIGVMGGHLLYYRDVTLNAWGIFLWVVADTLDSVDGQLARMTNHKSRFGRILDGLGGNIIFLSIYLHLYARMTATYAVDWPWLLLFVLLGGISHSIQSSLADYYRNAYIKFVVDPARAELDGSDELRNTYASLRFSEHPLKKILLRVYLNYTVQQEAFSKNFQRLRKRAASAYGRKIPVWFADEYRRMNRPLMKYYAILTTNTRMIVLAAAVLIDRVPLYFAIEVIVINFIMVLTTMHQEKCSAALLARIAEEPGAA